MNHCVLKSTRIVNIFFWNVFGFRNVNDIANLINNQDILCINETWLEKVPTSLPGWLNNFKLLTKNATRDKARGRAKGGLIVFYNVNFYNCEIVYQDQFSIFTQMTQNNNKFIVGSVYFPPSISETILQDSLTAALSIDQMRNFNYPIIIGGDFNCRIGKLNQLDELALSINTDKISHERDSLDTVVNKNGKVLIDFFEEHNFLVLNGRFDGDRPANFTYLGPKGNSVIDLIFCNNAYIEYVSEFSTKTIGTLSDHIPVAATLHLELQNEKIGNFCAKNSEKRIELLKWDTEFSSSFEEFMEDLSCTQDQDLDVNSMNNNLISAINLAAENLGMKKYKSGNKFLSKPWFDYECVTQKKILKDKLKNCKNSKFNAADVQIYKKEKLMYKNMLDYKRKKFETNILECLSSSKNPSDFWNAINKFKLRSNHSECINLSEWSIYLNGLYPKRIFFCKLLTDARHPLLDRQK